MNADTDTVELDTPPQEITVTESVAPSAVSTAPLNQHQQHWQDTLQISRNLAASSTPFLVSGRLTKVNGLVMEAVGLRVAVGELLGDPRDLVVDCGQGSGGGQFLDRPHLHLPMLQRLALQQPVVHQRA